MVLSMAESGRSGSGMGRMFVVSTGARKRLDEMTLAAVIQEKIKEVLHV